MVLRVGESHDRYYVAEVAMRILCRIDDPAEIQMAIRALKSQEADARWMMMRAARVLAEKGAARSIVRFLERLADD
jgi:3-methyladenine DNA glycosylase AlkC